MPRIFEKLSPAGIKTVCKPGMYGDGGGLWLHVGRNALDEAGKPTKTGKSWIFRYTLNGKAHEMGLGPVHTVGLANAREKARDLRKMVLEGLDPLEAKHAKRNVRKLEAAKAITFEKCAEKYIAAKKAGWSNAKHAEQWSATLSTYAFPTIGGLAVCEIATGHVAKILEHIWTAKPETASRIRGRIEAVLSYATTHGWRSGENPARWRGHLENVLPKKSKVVQVKHYAALPWREIGSFMAAVAGENGVAALALQFTILTAGRTGEVIGARWEEIDLANKVWTVPAERMKAKKEHRVPLSHQALAILKRAETLRIDGAEYVFPGGKRGAPLSHMSMLILLRRMKRTDITAHGFRSTFRDWAAETGQPSDIAEAALAHTLGNKVQAAYQRGDLLARRRVLMESWGKFCSSIKDGSDRRA